MIKIMEIRNFKSIKQLILDCKKINIIIGEPNTGKSNILEALGIFSYCRYHSYNSFKEFVRFERVSNLFYDEVLDEPIRINLDNTKLELQFQNNQFVGQIHDPSGHQLALLSGSHADLVFIGGRSEDLSMFKSYKFAVRNSYPQPESDFLLPLTGMNLMSLILTNKELRLLANEIFSKFGLELNLRPQENKIEVLKRLEGITVSYPYSLSSDTLQRIIFHLFAVLTNKDSVITFEEPESHAFPYYTKYFAETIALEERNNQFFISTHNPYFLLPLLEKSPKEDVAVTIAYYEDYQTKVKPLNDKEIQEITDIDIFSNLDRFLEKR